MATPVLQSSSAAFTAGASTLATTFSRALTTGNGVVVCVGPVARDASSVTDDQGNTYVRVDGSNFSTGPFSSVWYCPAVAGGGTVVTAHFASSTAAELVALEVVGTIAVDAHNAANGNSANGAAGAITTTAANCVVVATLRDTTVSGNPSGYTGVITLPELTGAAYLVAGTVQTGINPTWASASTQWAATVVAFSYTPVSAAYPPVPARAGPRLLGSPWLLGLPVIPWLTVQAPAVTPHADVPPVAPALPSAYPLPIRLGVFRNLPTLPPPPVQALPPVPPPTPLGPGHGKYAPLIRRLPNESDQRRGQRIADQLSGLINSLIGKGQLRQLGTSEWVLIGSAHTDARDPLVTDDVGQGFFVGAMWCNSATQAGFMCVSNAAGGAIWKQVT